ncbi:hypothetical protein CO704_12445 [Cedecea neteri]|uniref:Uncharacterized protein n=1 Tax=Cedecea neteri TaxID=158822 RepID=A0A291DYF5_9ENTR|nr:hypothetical protein CO704_12445 [Cedecea neteri]
MAGTVAAGDDARITGALQKGNNMSEIAAAGVPAQTAARANLGLKTGAVHDVQPTPTDATPETLLKMGSFGIGTPIRIDSIGAHKTIWDWCNDQVTGAYYFPNLVPNLACHVIYLFRDTSQDRTWLYFGVRTDTASPSFDITMGHAGHITSGIGK